MAVMQKRILVPFVMVLFLVVLGFSGFQKLNELIASVELEESVTIVVPSGTSTAKIANLLAENNLIRHPLVFRLYARLEGYDGKLRAGEYSFSGRVSLEDLGEKMLKGQVNTLSFTIPEGLTVDQIAELLDDKGIVNKDKFLQVIQDETFAFDYLPAPGHRSRLEGFLFPDTYKINKGTTERQIIEMMLARFDRVFEPAWREEVKKMNMTIQEMVTLASIIEREARVQADRPIISGVFHNRLKKGMLLQSCATVQFALGEVKPVLLYEDLKVPSPYNTYIHKGLPPGPIGAPGKAALKAAVFPEQTQYLYFVAKKDGSHHFSKTLAEHNDAKRKYLGK